MSGAVPSQALYTFKAWTGRPYIFYFFDGYVYADIVVVEAVYICWLIRHLLRISWKWTEM